MTCQIRQTLRKQDYSFQILFFWTMYKCFTNKKGFLSWFTEWKTFYLKNYDPEYKKISFKNKPSQESVFEVQDLFLELESAGFLYKQEKDFMRYPL